MTPAKLRLAQAAMANLCAELGVTRQKLYRFVANGTGHPPPAARQHGARLRTGSPTPR